MKQTLVGMILACLFVTLSVDVAIARAWRGGLSESLSMNAGVVYAPMPSPCAQSGGGPIPPGGGPGPGKKGPPKKKEPEVKRTCGVGACLGFGCKTGNTCKDTACDGKQGAGVCVSSSPTQTNPFWVWCPGWTWVTCSCADGCAPLPTLAILSGLATGAAGCFLRRKRAGL